MKKSILLGSLVSLCATAFAEFTSDIVVSNAGGNWSDASTWATPENAVPENSSATQLFTNLTLGEGKLILDANASNQYVENIIVSGSSASIEIAAGKTFTWDNNIPNTSTFLEKGKSITFSGDGELTIKTHNTEVKGQTGLSSNLTLDVNARFSSSVILSGGTLTVNKNLDFGSIVISNDTTNFIINENAVLKGTRLNGHNSGITTIYGSVTINDDFTMKGTTTVYGTLKTNQSNTGSYTYFNVSPSANPIQGKLTIKDGGKVIIGDRSKTKNNGYCASIIEGGTITVEKGATLDVLNGIKMHNNSTMNFNGGDVNVDKFIMANYNKSGAMTTTSTMTMNVSGATTLAKVVMDDGSFANANDTQLTINFNGLANGEALTINELVGLTIGRFIVLENFSDGDFFVKNALATNADGSIIGMTFGGESLFQLEDGKIVIPEPSTYAMIFGALALGFVAYRRRK